MSVKVLCFLNIVFVPPFWRQISYCSVKGNTNIWSTGIQYSTAILRLPLVILNELLNLHLFATSGFLIGFLMLRSIRDTIRNMQQQQGLDNTAVRSNFIYNQICYYSTLMIPHIFKLEITINIHFSLCQDP